MKRSLVAVLVGLLVAAAAPAGRTDMAVPTLVRVPVDSAEEAAFLLGNFDETHNHTADSVELLLWPGDRAELDALGIPYEVIAENLFERDQALEARSPNTLVKLPGPDRTDYRQLSDYNEEMKQLAKKNPDLVERFEMAQPSLEGRPIFGIEIAANVTKDDGRPVFYIDAVHHAREWPAAEYTMSFAHYLVEGFGKNDDVTRVLRNSRVIVVPIVNVDGFDYSRQSPVQNSNLAAGNGFEGYWRKNRRSLTGVTLPAPRQINPDAYGVDNNRNYPYLWGDSNGGSSGTHADQTYRGEAPLSEPENQNVRDIILGHNVTGMITNHTYQASVLRAGGGDAPEDDILTRIGDKMAKILEFRNAPTVGYPTTGTTDDWAYAVMGALGFTIEHGKIGFHPPYADEVGAHVDQTMKAFMVMADVVADPKYHSVIKGTFGSPTTLTLTKKWKTPLSPGNPTGAESIPEKLEMKLKTDPDGSFEWHVSPSIRPYEKKAEPYTIKIKTSDGRVYAGTILLRRGQVVNLGEGLDFTERLVGLDLEEGGLGN